MRKIKLKRYSAILLSAVLLILSLSAGVFATKNTPYPTPTNNFFVNDFADCINDSDEQKMQSMAEELYKKTTAQVVCVTVNSLEGEEVRDYALGLGREWGIGSKENNNGVLLLLSTEDRKIDIEVGYGLEGTLPDGKTGRILDDYAIPHLKNDDFSTGLCEAFSALIGETAKEYGIEIEGTNYVEKVNEDELSEKYALRMILLTFVFIIVILTIATFAVGEGDGSSYGGGGFSSGSGFSSGGGGFSSGGGFSGGGGSFGGGGSSSSF